MRILHFISSIDPRAGGPPAALVGMATAQRRIGFDVKIVATYQPGADLRYADTLQESSVQVTLAGPVCTSLGLHSSLARTVRSAVDAADAIHIHGLWEQIQYAAAMACRRAGKPYVMRPAGMLGTWSLQQSRLKKQIYMALRLRRMLNHASAIHYTADLERDEAAPLHLRPPSIVEPNGVDLAAFESLPDAALFRRQFPELGDRPYVLFLSRLHPKKGLVILLPAFAQTAPPDTALVLAGPGEPAYIEDLKGQVAQLGLTDRVVMTGMLSGDVKLAALAGAELFALPSHQENFGIAIVEALAAGTPVLISDRVNIYREIEAAGVGQATPPQVGPMATALRGWLSDAERRRLAADRARPFVREQYSWDVIARRWHDHYQSLHTTDR